MNVKYHVCAVEGENKAIPNPDVCVRESYSMIYYLLC